MKEVGKSLNCVKMKNCEQICSVFLSQCRSIRQNLLYLSPSWHLRAYLTNCYQFIWISKLYSTYLYALYLSCTYKRKLNFLIIQQTWYWTLIAQFCICNNFISAFIHFLFSVFFLVCKFRSSFYRLMCEFVHELVEDSSICRRAMVRF